MLFLCSTLEVGGAERQIALLVPRLESHGFKACVVSLRQKGRYFDELAEAGVAMVHVGMSSRFDLRGAFRGYRLWRKKPSIVFTQTLDAQIIGEAIARRAGASHVTVDHAGAGYERGRYRELLTRLLLPHLDRVVCVSATQVPDLMRLGARRAAIEVIPNGLPDTRVDGTERPNRSRFQLDEGDVVVILVATLRREKRADVFVDAVARARASDARVRGIVVGGGPELTRIRAQAETAGDGITVLGERTDVPELMALADAVCLSSDIEAAPMTLVEAMASAKPVIATNVGGVPDLVVEGETGWLVAPSDSGAFAAAILELAADRDRGHVMGENARREYERKYTVDRMVERYASVLADVTAKSA